MMKYLAIAALLMATPALGVTTVTKQGVEATFVGNKWAEDAPAYCAKFGGFWIEIGEGGSITGPFSIHSPWTGDPIYDADHNYMEKGPWAVCLIKPNQSDNP